MAFSIRYVHLHTQKFSSRVIFLEFSGWRLWVVAVFRFVFGLSHSSCKFLRFFRFAAFLHSSRSVAVSYSMFIPHVCNFVSYFQLPSPFCLD